LIEESPELGTAIKLPNPLAKLASGALMFLDRRLCNPRVFKYAAESTKLCGNCRSMLIDDCIEYGAVRLGATCHLAGADPSDSRNPSEGVAGNSASRRGSVETN